MDYPKSLQLPPWAWPPEGAGHLLELQKLIRSANASMKTRICEPDLLIVITGGEMAYRRNDGVLIVPIGTLKN
jgi:hypothetical protein